MAHLGFHWVLLQKVIHQLGLEGHDKVWNIFKDPLAQRVKNEFASVHLGVRV